jgi:hypothetical protein
VLCTQGIGWRLADGDESRRPAGGGGSGGGVGVMLGFLGGKEMRPREREEGKKGEQPGWRRPAATLAQLVAEGVATPPRLANGRRRDTSTRR